ncbi:hypothetical protein ACFVIM_31215 [Streptomyces sp. NPDC057638]|uniref:nSTAND1 domain-containing NTPase n=1 Tax=Streptomyces sp. NPDC057638 TaxID=3346190 RepID=UPI0036C806C7
MGRRERPVDPTAGPVQRFACELRGLRRAAGGATYRDLAARAGYSAVTLARAAGGERLPSLPVTLAYAGACGGDLTEWELRWRRAAREAERRAGGEPERAEPPYLGLARFQPLDHGRFFGRDRLVAELLVQIRTQRFITVSGPSGSGKSSLLRAGLIPALRSDPPTSPRLNALRVITPGARPVSRHAAALVPRGGGADTLLVVDQFEEVFTLCADPGERAAFLERLLTACDPGSGLRVIIVVRADHLERLAGPRRRFPALREATVLVGPMGPAELREAIVRPASAVGLAVERPLTARIIREVEGEPGGLALMSHALRETWRRSRGRTLTEEAYEAAGGVCGALARTAEEVYTRLPGPRAQTARRMLLRLITPGVGVPDTRRAAERGELLAGTGRDAAPVLEALAGARLLTLDGERVEIAHEALLRAWPRLRGWIAADRDRLLLHRRLTEDARLWAELGRDPGALYRGTRLARAEAAFAGAGRGAELTAVEYACLTALERSYLAAALTARRAEERTLRALRALTVAVLVLLALSVVAGALAWRRGLGAERAALRAESLRITTLAQALRPEDPRRAVGLTVAAWRTHDSPETRRGLMEALAWQETDTFADPDPSPSAVRELDPLGRVLTSGGPLRTTWWDVRTHRRLAAVDAGGAYVLGASRQRLDARRFLWRGRQAVALRASATAPAAPLGRGRVLVLVRNRTLELRDAVSGVPLLVRTAATGAVPSAVVSADGRIAAVCVDGTLDLWDLPGRHRLRLPAPARAGRGCRSPVAALSPRGERLTLAQGGRLRTWDLSSGTEVAEVRRPRPGELALSGGGELLAAADAREITVWRVGSPAPLFRHALSDGPARSLRWDPDGRTLRHLGGPFGVSVRSLTAAPPPAPGGGGTWLSAARLGDGGALLATAGRQGPVTRTRVSDARTGRVLAELPGTPCPAPRELLALAHVPGAGVRVAALASAVGCDRGTTFTPDGRAVLVARNAPGPAGTVRRWTEVRGTGGGARPWPLPSLAGAVVAFSPDGRYLATSHGLWVDIRTGRAVRRTLGQDEVRALAFSADGSRLAVGDRSGRVTVWGASAARRPVVVTEAERTGPVAVVALSPDGRTLAVADSSGALRLWDLSPVRPGGDGVPRRLTGAPLPVPGGAPLALAFSRDGESLHTVGATAEVRTLPIAPERVAAVLCARALGPPGRPGPCG